MDVECSVPPRLSEEDYAREIILAAYHRDAARVASVLRLCGPKATAEMSLSRAAAVQLLDKWTRDGTLTSAEAGDLRSSLIALIGALS